ncbi:hypothetical protein BH10BAC5_BH10BAC5_03550 [soil metagenome]
MERKEFLLLMDDYLDNELNTSQRIEFENAISSDSSLRSEYEEHKKFINEFKTMDKNITPPDEIYINIEREIDDTFKPDIKMYSNNVMSISFDSDQNTGGSGQIHKAGKSWYIWSAAAVFMIAFSIFLVYKVFKSGNDNTMTDGYTNWQLINLTGNATVNGTKASKLNIGDLLETDVASSVVLKFDDGSNITIEPNSKIRLISSSNSESRIEVISGTINTENKVLPGKILVEANNVKVRDNGASYTFNVDDKGNGIVYVKDGKVSFVSNNNRQAYIPEGNYCYSQPEKGVGTPFRKDSKSEFQQALFSYDFGNNKVPEAVYSVLANANVQDAYSLVNLLPRLDNNKKILVFNKLSKNGAAPTSIRLDSLKDFDENDAKIWIDAISPVIKMKIHSEINNAELKKEMEQLSRDMSQMNSEMKLNAKQMAEDMKKEMKELQSDLKEMNAGLKDSLHSRKFMKQFNLDDQNWKELQKDMIEMHKDLQESFKDIGKDYRELGEEMREKFKDMGENYKVEFDTAGFFKSYNSGMHDYMNYFKNFDTVQFHEQMKELEKLKDLKVPYFDEKEFKEKFKDIDKNFNWKNDSTGIIFKNNGHKVTIRGKTVIVDGDTLKPGDNRKHIFDDDSDKEDDKDKEE